MRLTDDELERHLRALAFEEECELFVTRATDGTWNARTACFGDPVEPTTEYGTRRRGVAGSADRRSALDDLLAQFEARDAA